MPSIASSGQSENPPCYRCAELLDGGHWVKLSIVHQNPLVDRFTDVEKRVCLDCVAAIGLLKFEDLAAVTEE